MHWNFNLAQLPSVAKQLLLALGQYRVVALYGPMGAGKTTLVHAICEVMGVRDAVGSPTFSIINEYAFSGGSVFHIDCYRLRDEAEAIDAGVEDCLFSGEWCFVEWPEKIPHLFPADAAIIRISVTNATTRSLDLEIKL
ncbi:tRNA (adenosine(37)-N6)-threonylcarbamoyltransferase complex ATPase subunit type 1 TsaE [Flavihumibacter fluvii]|uniref:tRNA (adenosine(37)-N6)-threonylcarbamoyltransferase complex ATPase subunit type 1 TsaE n=1 Tax=Flavihumibacter fluvii TaxID=2838157 RepID=UPI001BDEFF2F|nr:tRNA (adenosine(37)-N6)-threonylcarbamoyltransferase complex ATPase subunit type 1 TsaE [Flavihumibacter fluvii]ULQ52554.1 tRNA (adenosine(37)-N6)-threonylcarbamoyltransferase complex ATPase subunit type 1 TsaE [Flavihumibacter fluvii]